MEDTLVIPNEVETVDMPEAEPKPAKAKAKPARPAKAKAKPAKPVKPAKKEAVKPAKKEAVKPAKPAKQAKKEAVKPAKQAKKEAVKPTVSKAHATMERTYQRSGGVAKGTQVGEARQTVITFPKAMFAAVVRVARVNGTSFSEEIRRCVAKTHKV